MKTGIYKIQNIFTNNSKDCYVGSVASKGGFKNRWSKHRRDVMKQNHHSVIFQRAWSKYGSDSFQFQVIEYVKRPYRISDKQWKNLILAREQYYLDSIEPRYNVCKIAGNTLGRRHSKETCDKISNTHCGKRTTQETKQKISAALSGINNHMYGKTHTHKAKSKIRAARAKQSFSESTRCKMSQAKIGNRNHFYGKKHTEESKRKMRISSSKLSNNDCLAIQSLLKDSVSAKEIAVIFDVSIRTIYRAGDRDV